MGVDQRFRGVAGFGYIEIVRDAARAVYPPGKRPYYCLPDDRRLRARHGRDARRAAVPGLDLCQISKLLGDTRDSGQFSAFVVSSSARPRDVRGRRARLPRRRRARRRSASAAARATGWIIGLFDSEPILRSSVAGQTGVAVSLEREHAAVPENRVPTGAGAAFRTLSETLGSSSIARFGTVPHGAALTPPDLGRGRRPLDGHGLARARRAASRPRRAGRARASWSGS